MEALVSELQGSVYRNVSGYEAKYFPKSLHETDEEAQVKAQAETGPDRLSFCLQSPPELLQWLDSVRHQQQPDNARTKFIFRDMKSKHDGTSGPIMCLVWNSATRSDRLRLDTDILVFGLLQTAAVVPAEDEAILTLCHVAASVFADMPDRRFLHAFRLYDSTMETWTFDRAGAYSGESFDITKEPHRLRNILAGYMVMKDDELGLNSFLQQDDQGVFVELEDSIPSGGRTRLSVDKDAFVKQDCLIGPGTTCFKAQVPGTSGPKLVVKLCWSEGEGSMERRHLQFANDRDVWGIIRLQGYHDLGDIAHLRQGLRFGQPYHLFLPGLGAESSPTTSPTEPEPTLNPSSLPEQAAGDLTDHENEVKFCNLKFECLVTSPLGRPLQTFSSPSQLAAVLGDIVKALRSLYLQANILHRDVSPRNIIIVCNGPRDADAAIGMLIDLDFALDLSHPAGQQQLVGTQGFMAIGILGGDEHTYRHDLESLFYVFLWMAICHDGGTSEYMPEASRLHAWRSPDFLATFHTKRRDMQPGEFSKWTEEEFTKHFRPYLPLAATLHQLLFPVRKGKIFIGTDHEPGSAGRLYEGMIAAFERYA